MLRANGLTAEQTDRFMNYCLIIREPLYYPCMMEFTGEMLAAVNEMLLQSHNGIIRVFPAIPDGVRDYSKLHRNGYSITNYMDKFSDYDAWNDVRIDKLLAKGAFEVSALLRDRELKWIKVKSLKGGSVRLTSPFMKSDFCVMCQGALVESETNDGIIYFETRAGNEYLICDSAACIKEQQEEDKYSTGILEHITYTKQPIYIGQNAETQYQRQLNSFIRDWYLGNMRMQNHTVYKFDFTDNMSKDYGSLMPRQAYAAEERVIPALQFVPFGAVRYNHKTGYGFLDEKGIRIIKRQGPDLLRQDFAEGTMPAQFAIEVPRGQYEVLVVSGDIEEESITVISEKNGRTTDAEIVDKGEYQCKLIPVVMERDGRIELSVSTKQGYKWKINAILLNIIKGY